MFRSIIAATMFAAASFASVSAADAQNGVWSAEDQPVVSYTANNASGGYADNQTAGQDRLMIVDRKKRRVI
jgi:hypothetical protein